MSSIKSKTVKGMTQQQLDLLAEWDPCYLQSLKEQPDTQATQVQNHVLGQKQNMNVPHVPKSQISTSFDEWKAMALQSGRKENASPLPSPTKNKATATSIATATPSQPQGFENQNPGTTGDSTATSTTSQHGKSQRSPPKMNSRRNVKTNSSSMIPVYSPKRNDRAVKPHRGVRSRPMEESSASASVEGKSRPAPPEPMSHNATAVILANPTPAEKPKEEVSPKIIARRRPTPTSIGNYKAPNGTPLNSAALARLSLGVKGQNNDTTIFRPSFVADPWEKVKLMKTTCLSR